MYAFSLPAQVVRHAGALDAAGELCRVLGRRALLVGGHTALSVARSRLQSSLRHAGVDVLGCEWFGGLCSEDNAQALAERARSAAAEMIVAVGGGKAIDTGKLAAERAGLPVVTVPTVAATCAAFSTVSARYLPDGHFELLVRLSRAPAAVLIDSGVLAAAPARWLAAGLGDTLAKWYEFRAISAGRTADGPTLGVRASSRLCYDLIVRFGGEAQAALATGRATPALEAVLDAIVIHAGMTSIMGVGAHAAAAHAVFEGFTVLARTRELGHGFLVGYGNLVLLALEKRSDEELREALELAAVCGLPRRLADLAPLDAEELRAVAEASIPTQDMGNMPFAVSADDVLAAIRRVEALAGS